jgi:ribosome-associated toxin RatA of RatAB toxin-antitoxin module
MTRSLFVWPLAFVATLVLQLPASAVDNPADARHDVSLRHHAGIFTVTATFAVPHDPSLATTVLTDYEQISRFLPDVTRSVVLQREAGRTVVEQEAVARLLMFSKRVHLVLEVQQEEGVIRFRDRCGRSFSRYEGSWRLTAADGRTTIAYELTAKPSFDVPEFILGRLLKRDARKMIEGLRQEMARRDTAGSKKP